MSNTVETMSVIGILEPGGPDVLEPEERIVPDPGDGEILIEVAAAGVNRPDILQRQGHYPPPPGASDVPGLEVAGTIVGLGRGSEPWSLGDRVVALVPGGGYAEMCIAKASSTLPLPDNLTMIEGAGLPETTFTVWHNLFQRGALRPGETVLIHGGSSGIGTTAIQLAKAFDAIVIATASSEEKCAAIRQLGADVAINYMTTDYVTAIKQATNDNGVDVTLDMVGGDYTARNMEAAAVDGRIVQIAFLNGPLVEIDLRHIMMKRLTLTGSTLRARSSEFKASLADNLRELVWPMIANGQYAPIVDKVFPLEEAADAHRRMEAGSHIGKIILSVGE